MAKRHKILLGFLLFTFTPIQAVKAESVSKVEHEIYVTTEVIISDIVFPTTDKKVQKKYSDDMMGMEKIRRYKIQ
ncbi:hypothetical protein [Peribacillus frigoritolerans]|uniref:hypothetical protein n=1 Tax=Peribacillus frigoritolerans TaxID=450367 RepID=UPI002EACF5F8|nr:hypothetical protein [Peribacillus frigoritolerans]